MNTLPLPNCTSPLTRLRSLVTGGVLLVAPLCADAQEVPEAPLPFLTELEYLYLYLDLNLKLENYAEAERTADGLLAKNSKDPLALGAKTTILLKRKDAEAALAFAERYRAVSPGPDADSAMVAALNLNRRFDEALEILDRLKERAPKGEPFRYQLDYGFTYYGQQKLDKAREIFVSVRDDRRYSMRQRFEAGKQLANIERDESLLYAYRAIERRDLEFARELADRLDRTNRGPNREITALVAILDAEEHGKVDEAIEVLEKLRETTPEGEEFAYHSALATQYLDKGRYEDAEKAAEAAANLKSAFSRPESAHERLDTLRAVRPYTRSTVSLDVQYEDRAEGEAVRFGAKASMPLKGGKTRIGAEYGLRAYDLDGVFDGGANSEYHIAYLTAKQQLTDRIFATAAVGMVDGEFAYRASLGWKRPSKDTLFEVTYSDGKRPTDTLQLESLGASERRLSVQASGELPANRKVRVTGEAFWREIDLDNASINRLGSGWGLRAQIEYLVFRRQRSMLSVSYIAGFENFDFSSDARSMRGLLPYDPMDLVEDDYHSHGLAILGQRELAPDLVGSVRLGADYRLDSHDVVFSLGGGLEWWFSDYARLVLDASYYTSGKAANEDDGYLEGRVGVDMTF